MVCVSISTKSCFDNYFRRLNHGWKQKMPLVWVDWCTHVEQQLVRACQATTRHFHRIDQTILSWSFKKVLWFAIILWLVLDIFLPLQSSSNKRPSSCKHPHDRDTNDITPTLGAHLPVPHDLLKKFNDTRKHKMNDSTRRNYHCWQKTWWSGCLLIIQHITPLVWKMYPSLIRMIQRTIILTETSQKIL